MGPGLAYIVDSIDEVDEVDGSVVSVTSQALARSGTGTRSVSRLLARAGQAQLLLVVQPWGLPRTDLRQHGAIPIYGFLG